MASTRPTNDVVTMLREQHDQIRRLMQQVKDAPGPARGQAFEPLVRLLAVHETSEEEVVYPMVRRDGDSAAAAVEERKHEEDEAKKTLAQLEHIGPEAPDFLSAFTAFAADVEQHASAEERTIFPLLEANRDDEELQRMATRLKGAQALAPTHAHASAPESAVGNMLIGPFVAMVDRVRDAIRDARS